MPEGAESPDSCGDGLLAHGEMDTVGHLGSGRELEGVECERLEDGGQPHVLGVIEDREHVGQALPARLPTIQKKLPTRKCGSDIQEPFCHKVQASPGRGRPSAAATSKTRRISYLLALGG